MRIYNIYHDIRKNSIYYRPKNCPHARIYVIQKDGISGSILPRIYVISESRCNFFFNFWWQSGEPKPIVHFFVQCRADPRLSLIDCPIVSLI